MRKNLIPFESVMAKVWNTKIFKYIDQEVKDVKEKQIPEKKQEIPKPKESKEVKKDIEKTDGNKEVVPKAKPSDFKNFTPDHQDKSNKAQKVLHNPKW